MPLKPLDHTLIHGKKFMSLGGGHDPIRLEQKRQQFVSLNQRYQLTPKEPKLPHELIGRPTQKELDAAAKLPEEKQEGTVKPILSDAGYIWPIEAGTTSQISSDYGYRNHPITGKYHFHKGVDIAAKAGSAVLATTNGKISDIGQHIHLGKFVKLTHEDGTYSLYGHLSEFTAKPGQTVKQGDTIGKVGSTGRSTGPHLDYSIRKADGSTLNPMDYLTPPESLNLASKN